VNTDTQSALILRHLSQGWSLTPLEALREYECFRLAARVFDLREAGHDIHMALTTNTAGKRVGVYTLISKAKKKVA